MIKNTSFWIGRDNQNTVEIFEKLDEEYEKREIGYLKNITNLSSQLLVALARNYAGSEKASDYAKITPDDRRMIITDEMMVGHYASITLRELATRLSLSPRQTQRFLKKTYGKTFVEIRSDLRRSIADKLVAGGKTRSEAADMVGYKNARSLKHN